MCPCIRALALPWLVGTAIWLAGPAPVCSAALAVFAVLIAMSLSEVSRAKTENPKR